MRVLVTIDHFAIFYEIFAIFMIKTVLLLSPPPSRDPVCKDGDGAEHRDGLDPRGEEHLLDCPRCRGNSNGVISVANPHAAACANFPTKMCQIYHCI